MKIRDYIGRSWQEEPAIQTLGSNTRILNAKLTERRIRQAERESIADQVKRNPKNSGRGSRQMLSKLPDVRLSLLGKDLTINR